MRVVIGVLAGFLISAGLAAPVHAQDYPSKPVRLIVPNEAGGGSR